MTPGRRANIVIRGDELLDSLNELVDKYPTRFERAAGSGLLAAIHVNPDVNVTGAGGLEERCRRGVVRCEVQQQQAGGGGRSVRVQAAARDEDRAGRAVDLAGAHFL